MDSPGPGREAARGMYSAQLVSRPLVGQRDWAAVRALIQKPLRSGLSFCWFWLFLVGLGYFPLVFGRLSHLGPISLPAIIPPFQILFVFGLGQDMAATGPYNRSPERIVGRVLHHFSSLTRWNGSRGQVWPGNDRETNNKFKL